MKPPPSGWNAVRLLEEDAELADALADAARRRDARLRVVVPASWLDAGPLEPARLCEADRRSFALLVLDGVVMRDVVIAGRVASDLLGPGDVAGLATRELRMLPRAARLTVVERAHVAVLGDHARAALGVWPEVALALHARAVEQAEREMTHRAIAQLSRVGARLVALFWHLAERHGRVTQDGIVVPVALTHQMLGQLVGARRPTVSLALKDLATGGALTRRPDGSWLLRRDRTADRMLDAAGRHAAGEGA